MKYYLIVGEASGDLHASRLMCSLKKKDPKAEFRFFGGDQMIAQGGECVRHFKEIAYMGFVPVVKHLPTILAARKQCKEDIMKWNPDAVILVDYAGFNLDIARFLKTQKNRKGTIFYFIAPKIWAWKEGRIKNFKRDVDEMLCILPFEVDFFEKKHNYSVRYVGNPTANEVAEFKADYKESFELFCERNNLDSRPVIALLAGSRRQEIKDNLDMMIAATRHLAENYQFVVAGAPSIADELYDDKIAGTDIKIVKNQTYALLSHATAALVTSGTATLETACFGVPQVVLYKTPSPAWLARFVWDNFFKVKYISLVNLIAGKEVVPEMMAEKFTVQRIKAELDSILPGRERRTEMLQGYSGMIGKLEDKCAPDEAAGVVLSVLKDGQ